MSELERSLQVYELLISQAGKLRAKRADEPEVSLHPPRGSLSRPCGPISRVLGKGFLRKSISFEYSSCARLSTKPFT